MFTLKSNNDDLLVFNGLRSLCFVQVNTLLKTFTNFL